MIFAFDDFELDPERLELRRAGKPVKAEPSSLRLLASLLRKPGRLVTKHELLVEAWDGRRVAENALTVSMVRLRRVLGQGSGQDEPIATVHGRGYRFARPVIARDEATQAAEPAFAPSEHGEIHASAHPHAVDRPLVGREGVLLSLRAAMARARAGNGGLCVLSGEAGIGKTRVVEELCADASAAAYTVAWGYCRDAGSTPPLWPLAQLVRELLANRDAPDAKQDLSLAPILAQLAPLLPELRASSSPSTDEELASFGPAGARHLIFDALSRVIRALSVRTPLVLVLDDVQRADPASFEYLRYLIDEIARLPVLLACTLRDGEPAASEAREHFDYVLGHRNCARVALARLDLADVAAYVALHCDDASGALGRAVYDKSEGNPFFMAELVRGLLDGERGALELPRAAREIMRQRIAGLPREARGVLASAAIIGRSFEVPLLQTVTGSTPEALMEALDVAVDRGIVQAAPDSRTAFAFSHELLRAVLADSLDGAEQRAEHLRVALALEQRSAAGDDVPAAGLAHHYHVALPHTALPQMVQACLRAAEDAARVYASSDVLRHLDHALEALDLSDAPSGTNPFLRRRILMWQAVQARACPNSEFERKLRALLRFARDQRDGVALARAALMLDPHAGFPPMPGSHAALVEALELVPGERTDIRAAVFARLAVSAPFSYDRVQSQEQLDRGLALCDAAPSLLARYATRTSQLYLTGGVDAPETQAMLADLDALCRERKAELSVPPVLLDLHRGIAALQSGQLAQAGVALERSAARCRKLEHRELSWHIERSLAVLAWNAGRVQQACGALRALHARPERETLVGSGVFVAHDVALLLRRATPVEGPREAELDRAALREALLGSEEDPPSVWSMKVRSLAALELHDDAMALLARVTPAGLAELPHGRDWLGTLGALAVAVRALCATRAEAVSYVAPLAELIAPHRTRFFAHVSMLCEGSGAQLLGMLELARGQRELAIEPLEQAVELAARAGLVVCEIDTRRELARCLAMDGSAEVRARAAELEVSARTAGAALGLGLA